MNGNIVSAAKWFGVCLIVSSLVLVVGLDRCGRQMSAAIENAGEREQDPRFEFPVVS